MRKRNIPVPVSRRWVLFATVVAIAGLSASLVNAASVFMWVADGSNVTGYSQGTNGTANSATAVAGASLTCSGDCFSLATSGTSGTSEDLYVANSGSHTLSEYSWSGTALTQIGSSVSFTADPNGGNVSPQEIAIDGSGNLWTTSIDGQIVKYNATIGSPTIVEAANGTLAGARGIMISGTEVYVTVDGAYGANSSVYMFPTTGGTPTLYHNIVAATVGGQQNGQMRGIAVDTGSNIFYADSTWAPNGTNEGYINRDTSSTAVTPGLGGPNELETGLGTLVASGTTYDCDILYEANYYAGTIEEIATGYDTGGTTHSHCGNAEEGTSLGNYLQGLVNPSGIALSPGYDALGGDSVGVGPTFISDPVTSTPEPGTLALMIGSLLLALGIAIRFQRRRRLQ